MPLIEMLAIAIGLAMDAFAVSIASSISIRTVQPRQVFRMAFHFGLFHIIMPLIGWFAGSTVSQYIGGWDHWVAFGLLVFVGGKSIYDALFSEDDLTAKRDPTRGWTLVLLSVAISIDSLAVGMSLAFLEISVYLPILLMGLATGLMSMVGMIFGAKIGSRFGDKISIAGGLILITIGVKIVLEHSSG